MKNKVILMLIGFVMMFCGCSFSGIISNLNNENIQNNSNYTSNLIAEQNYSSKQELIENVSPAVVGIICVSGNYQSIGSGVCVNEKGYVLTNNHVVEDADFVKLYLYDGSTCSASIVWADASLDLAVLKSSCALPYLNMASEGSYSSGEEVVAIGTPISLAFKHSATFGIISALNRTIQVDNSNGYSTLSNLIQHDASINPGNSGGPLIDMKGRVLGINTVKVVDAEGMGFAIPISIGNKIVSNLSANGSYKTSYLGVFGFDANLKDIENHQSGVYVVDVKQDSPAFESGIKNGDIITKFNGKQIENVLKLREELYSLNANDSANITVARDGKEIEFDVVLNEHPCCYKSSKLNYADFR